MKQKRQVISLCVVFALAVSGLLYWVYRHPDYRVQQEGILTADSGIAVSTGGAPIPKDIEEQASLWAQTLRQQSALYDVRYASHEVRYATTVQSGETVVEFWGTGVTRDGQSTDIQDTVILPFALYGVA